MRNDVLVWMIEDDEHTWDFWQSVLKDHEGGRPVRLKTFYHVMETFKEVEAPDVIVWDAGSIGLMLPPEAYLSAFMAVRERYFDTPIYVTSGLPYVPVQLKQDLPDDDLLWAAHRCGPMDFCDWLEEVGPWLF